MVENNRQEVEAVDKLIKVIRVKLESMPVRNSKIMKSSEILDQLETKALIEKQSDQLAVESLVTFLASITLAPIKQEINQLKRYLNLSI